MLKDGRLSLATAALLAPKLTPENLDQLLREVSFKSKRDVALILARRHPQPAVPSVVRKLPEPNVTVAQAASEDQESVSLEELMTTPPSQPASRRPIVTPLSEAHYKLQVTISASARGRLSQIQDLMRHRLPSGDLAAIVEHALEVLHAELLKKKTADVEKPRMGRAASEAKGRYIPASVKRAVYRRDQGRRAFVSLDGTRCGSTSGVEFHHVHPYAVGEEATADNLEMRCRAHNGCEWARHLDAESEALAGP